MAIGKSNSRFAGAAVIALLSLSACSPQSASTDVPVKTDTASNMGAGTTLAPKTVALELAGEPFEALTEQAFTADRSKLMSLYNEAETAALGVRDRLSPQDAQTIDGLLTKTKTAIAAGKSTEIALSAVERYKLIVSAFPPDAKIPVEVSLLDYAGFRVQADLKASPARWEDAKTATDYAMTQWGAIAGKVGDKALHDKFGKSLSSLNDAVANKDLKMAASAATHELDIVDELEHYFKTR